MEVSNYLHKLHSSAETLERRRAALRDTAACMTGADGEDFECAVRENADRVDVDN
jgi:hypothetical protein